MDATANRGTTAVAKPWQFQKGQSGNPRGRPKLDVNIRELAKKKSPRAFERILELVESDDERVAMAAAKEVLDRAWGKPGSSEDEEGGKKGAVTINIVKFTDGNRTPPEQLESPAISIRAVEVP